MVSRNSSLPGIAAAITNWPPISLRASNSVTWWPREAAIVAHDRPAMPAPTTAMRLRVRAGR